MNDSKLFDIMVYELSFIKPHSPYTIYSAGSVSSGCRRACDRVALCGTYTRRYSRVLRATARRSPAVCLVSSTVQTHTHTQHTNKTHYNIIAWCPKIGNRFIYDTIVVFIRRNIL